MAEQLIYQETDRLAAEINLIKQQAARQLLTASIEIGERLTQAKAIVPHGEWEQWLADNVDYSQSTAQNLMKIYREYGSDQLGFAGKTALDTFGKLSYTQALELLALPSDQREEFVETHDVEDMSTRDLHQAIAEVKAEAEKELEEAQREKQIILTRALTAERTAESAERTAEEAKRALQLEKDRTNDANSKAETATAQRDRAEKALLKQAAATEKAQKEIAKLKSQVEELTKPRELTAEERAAIEKEIASKYEADIAQLNLLAADTKLENERLRSEREALEEKYKKQANADLQKFQALFEVLQRDLAACLSLADTIGGETGEKLKALVKKTVGGE